MTLTKTKILFILLLTISLLTVQSCSMDDDDESAPMDSNKLGDMNVLSSKFIVLPGNNDPMTGLDSLNSDTLKIFPHDIVFHKMLMQCMVSSLSMVHNIASSIDETVLGKGTATWMDYYSSYLGVYSSLNDSRSKQWDLEQDVLFDGRTWAYHLTILDLPEGVTPENKEEHAVEIFYDADFSRGVMFFSPTDFDAVGFPKKIFGPDIKGMVTFSKDDSNIINELYLTNIGINNNVKYIRNVYLHTALNNNCVSIKAMIDFPTLWFDVKENNGFTVSAVGACDLSTGGAVVYSGIVRNSNNEKSVASLVVENPSYEVLGYYYPLWQNMIEESENNSSTVETDDNNNDGNDVETISDPKSAGNNVEVEVKTEYGKPGYYLSGEYVPASTITDKSPYLRALNRSLSLMDGDFPISPYKNSVNQVEWSSVEKSR